MRLVSIMQDSIPIECAFEGELFDAYSWYDKNNKNYLIRSSKLNQFLISVLTRIYLYVYNELSDGSFKNLTKLEILLLNVNLIYLLNILD